MTCSASSCCVRSGDSGNAAEQVERPRRVVGGLAVGVLAQRVLARLTPIPRRPLVVPAVLEVHGELAGDLARALAVPALEALAGPQVQSHALPDGDARIEHLLIQRVNEGIPPRHRPIRPLGDAGRAKELAAPRQRLAPPLRFLRRRSRPRPATAAENSAPATLATASIACSSARQALDLLVHELPQRLRRARPRRPPPARTAPTCPSTSRSCPWAIRSSIVLTRKAGCRRCSDEARAPAPTGARAGESAARDTVATAARLRKSSGISSQCPCICSSCFTGFNGCARGRHIGGPVRPEDEQPRRFAPAGQHRPAGRSWPRRSSAGLPAAARAGASARQGVQRLHQLPQHPVARGALRAALHGLQIRGRPAAPATASSQVGACCLRIWTSLFAPRRATRVVRAPRAAASRLRRRRSAPRIARGRCAASGRRRSARETLPPAPSCRSPAPRSRRRAAAGHSWAARGRACKLRELGLSPHQAQGRVSSGAQGLVPSLGAGPRSEARPRPVR